MFRRSVGDTSKQPYFHLSACRRSSGAGIQSAIQGEWVFTRRIEDCAKPPAPGVSQAALCRIPTPASTPRNVAANCDHGVLELTLPLTETAKPPRIAIGTGSNDTVENAA